MITSCTLFEISSGPLSNGTHFKKSQYCLASNSTIGIISTPKFMTCETECSRNPVCKVFSFNLQSKTCSLGIDIGSDSDKTCSDGEESYQKESEFLVWCQLLVKGSAKLGRANISTFQWDNPRRFSIGLYSLNAAWMTELESPSFILNFDNIDKLLAAL